MIPYRADFANLRPEALDLPTGAWNEWLPVSQCLVDSCDVSHSLSIPYQPGVVETLGCHGLMQGARIETCNSLYHRRWVGGGVKTLGARRLTGLARDSAGHGESI